MTFREPGTQPKVPLATGMRTLLARRAAEIDAGAARVGWKIGFNAKGMQEHFGLDGPIVGYLTDSTLCAAGEPIAIGSWQKPALEVEVAIRVSGDGGVAALAPALELVDLDPALRDIEAILAGNIFHRGVVFGPELVGVDVRDLRVSVAGPHERLCTTGRLVEAPGTTVDIVRAFLAAHGAELLPGDRIIAGSLIAPLPLEPGDALEVAYGVLGALTARFV
jgi:2-keto-4-pentenoate hydratase